MSQRILLEQTLTELSKYRALTDEESVALERSLTNGRYRAYRNRKAERKSA